ncbi:MAG: hypothetical protein RLY85_217 [Bacteroidota bacterium]
MLLQLRFLYKKIEWFIRNHRRVLLIDAKTSANHYLGPITYDTDILTTSNNCDFIREPRFAQAYKAAADTKPWDGFTSQWRVYIVCWFADHVKNLDGDFVECGVNTGAFSRAIIEYVDFNKLNKTFHLLDTFEGFPTQQITEEERKAGIGIYATHYHPVYEEVKKTFQGFNVNIIKGMIPDSLEVCKTVKIAFLSIDMNAVVPEMAAIHYFWDKLVVGGVVILDDYGFPMHTAQKLAFDEFAQSKNTNILSLPTGQGIMFKK